MVDAVMMLDHIRCLFREPSQMGKHMKTSPDGTSAGAADAGSRAGVAFLAVAFGALAYLIVVRIGVAAGSHAVAVENTSSPLDDTGENTVPPSQWMRGE